jgi:hypothetical protein
MLLCSFVFTKWLVNLLIYTFIIFIHLFIYILRSGSLFIKKLWVELGKIKNHFKVLG